MQRFAGHALAAGHFFELFVSAGHAIAAHHGLNRLGQHFPGGVQVCGQCFFVQLQLVQACHERLVRQHGVAQAHAHVAQHGRVGQVALPAANRQLLAQVLEHRIGQAQIALGVFKVNRVDLVRHGGRANLTCLELLLEVAHAHIAPNIACQVNQNGVAARHRVKQLGHVVVRLNLNAVGLKSQAQAHGLRGRRAGCGLGRFHHTAAKGLPVHIGPGTQVRVVVAHGTVHLGHERHGGNAVQRGLQTHRHIGQLFAHRGGAGRLAVGAAEHGHRGIGMCHVAQLVGHALQARHQHLLAAVLDLQRMAGVVDVFAGARKVHKLARLLQLGPAVKHTLDAHGLVATNPVFHRLHVVVGGFFNRFNGLGISRAKRRHHLAHMRPRRSA